MFLIYNSYLVIVPASNNVWKDIIDYLGGSMSVSSIHTFVHKGRYQIKEKLGILTVDKSTTSYDFTNILTNTGS